jgi:carbonic anhydrase
MLTATDALLRLREGNARFVAGETNVAALASEARRAVLVDGQEPFAIILGCSDSRVPAELVFDQGLGDLFVIRVGGNIVAPSQVGSVEFAAARFGTPLVVVMGHTQCGVVTAALDSVLDGANDKSRNMRSLVDRVRPAVLAAMGSRDQASIDRAAVIHDAVRVNVRASADHLRHGSALLEGLIRDRGLAVVGAEYSIETGVVDFFDLGGD